MNIFLVNGRRDKAKAGARAEASPKSRPGEPKITELYLLEALSPYVIASLRVKSLFGLLGATKLYRGFF